MDDLEQLIRGGQTTAKKDYSNLITDDLLDRLRKVESGKDNFAVNKQTKALGAYQFMPETVADFHRRGVEFNPFNEKEARQVAKQYLTDLVNKNGGDLDKALASYGGFVTKDPSQYVGKVKGDGKTSAPVDDLEQLIRGFATPEQPKPEPVKPQGVTQADMSKPFVGYPSAKKPTAQQPSEANTQPVRELGQSFVSLADQPINLVTSVLDQAAYPLARFVYGFQMSPEEAAAKAKAETTSPKNILGRALGIEQTPGYQAEVTRAVPRAISETELAKYITEHISEGVDALSAKTGLPKADIESMIQSLGIAAGPALGKGLQATGKGLKAAAGTIQEARELVQPQKTITTQVGSQQMSPTQLADLQAAFEQKKAQFATQKPMGSVGAAAVDTPELRIQRAAELPIPIELSKDQVTRNPADVRFARETAKDPVLGKSLQEHYARQNDLIQRNLDHMVEETGAEFTGLNPRELGEKLVNVVAPNKTTRKREVQSAYKEAKNSGEMAEAISVSPLEQFVASHQAEAINAPVIKSLEIKIQNLKKDGQISLNDIEEVRKMVTRLSQDTPTNAKYGGDINRLIDAMTKDKGGDLYKKARRLNADFMTEFEDTPVLKNITALKNKNSTQRAVAMEDLIDKSLIRGSYDDVQRLFSSLEKMGEPGQQMISELKGAVAQRIKDNATKNVQLDINGKPYVSTANLNNTIVDLDKSGKLELLFGKKGAETYRTLNQVTKEIQTVPQGTTNPSGTAAQIGAMLTEIGLNTMATGIPAPLLTGGKMLYNIKKQKEQQNKISDFINFGKEKQ